MDKNIEIYQGIHVIKENKTAVDYFLFDEYEVHFNTIPAHALQEWHFHQLIEEVILVVEGELTCLWLENQQKCCQVIHEKECVRVKQSIHTFANKSDKDCKFVVLRLVLDGKSKKEIIKNDKTVIKNIDKI